MAATTWEDAVKLQREERDSCLSAVLNSTAPKKLIVAGAGTGKTYTFRKLFEQKGGQKNVAMTFIRKLVQDMSPALAAFAEVHTFHAFCKANLHRLIGSFNLFPALDQLVAKDASLLKKKPTNYLEKIRSLDEDGGEIDFYISRGNYYRVVGFDDAVYRLYKILRESPEKTPQIDNLVIDEYQDFNPLEVALISQFEGKSNILIVGDDDQAIYASRSSTPDHLRRLFEQKSYEHFTLPYCSRCPSVIVQATNDLIMASVQKGHLKNRIEKRFEPYLESKTVEDTKYPKIIKAQVTLISSVSTYILKEMAKIPSEEIAESYKENYPTVLIIGPQHFLVQIDKAVREQYKKNIVYTPNSPQKWDAREAYSQLAFDQDSNLAWRLIADLFLDKILLKKAVKLSTESPIAFHKLLPDWFIKQHIAVCDAIGKVRTNVPLQDYENRKLAEVFGIDFENEIEALGRDEEEIEQEYDENLPKIMLTTFVGCKGLSASHVFIVGANNTNIPKDPGSPRDIEISQFLVALTRTRKQCHIISNKWFAFVKKEAGYPKPDFFPSDFISWISRERLQDLGYLRAADLK